DFGWRAEPRSGFIARRSTHDGAIMDWINRGFFALPLAIGLVLAPSAAQDRGPATPNAASPASTQRTLTGKERLGPKWTDEQRIDNCNVPIDKRGMRPRPNACENVPSD